MIGTALPVVRGWGARAWGGLALAFVVAWLLGNVSVQLRSGADLLEASPVLDRMILVGIALPVSIIVRMLEDRCPWLLATSGRRAWLVRAVYLAGVYTGSLALAACLAFATTGQESRVLVFADFALLLGLGSLAAVVLGADLGWTVPAVVAVVCSTPGLLPLVYNAPARADQAWNVLGVAWVLLGVALVLFATVDDHGFGGKRLRTRLSGVTDE